MTGMAAENIRLEPLHDDAEAEADALLQEQDDLDRSRSTPTKGTDDDDDDDDFKRGLEDLENSESLPPPAVQAISPVSSLSPVPSLLLS